MPETAIDETSLDILQHRGIESTRKDISPGGDEHIPDNVPKKRDIDHEYISLFCTRCGHKHVVMLNCGDRTCGICRKKWYGYHYKTLKRIVEAWGDKIRVIGLTIKNIPDNEFDKGDVRRIRKYFNRLIHRKYYKAKINGGFYFVHLTNQGKGWHLHLHVVYRGEYIPQRKLSADWLEITKDSYIVFIKPLTSVKKALQYLMGDLLQTPKIISSFKYKYNAVLKGSRLIQGFGLYSKVKFRNDFLCPVCGNNCWYCPDFDPTDWSNRAFDTS